MSDFGEDKMFVEESNSQEGESSQNPKKRTLDTNQDEATTSNQSSKLAKKIDDSLPLSCPICKKPFLDPIVTRCNHYFCHKCALEHDKVYTTCFVCDQLTLGSFNTAVEIKEKIGQVRAKAIDMVKGVRQMVEGAAVMVQEAEAMKADSAKMVASVETIMLVMENFGMDLDQIKPQQSWLELINFVEGVEKSAAIAKGKAEMAAEMMKEANATTEAARHEMVKALEVMKNVKWNV